MAEPRDTDAAPETPSGAADDLTLRLQRNVAANIKVASSDLNFQKPPLLFYDIGNDKQSRIYESAPTPLKRLFGSPVVTTGPFATGPKSERRVTSGWGAPRNFSYEKGVNTNSRHQGLDFAVGTNPLEAVIACADGRVTFVGIQLRKTRRSVRFPSVDDQGNIRDKDNNIVATPDLLGFGGIYVWIDHDGDFQGYRTEYYHLSKVLVAEGARAAPVSISEGTQIGNAGRTGVRDRNIGPHLHFQISFTQGRVSAFVNPTSLIPNYRPPGRNGQVYADSTNTVGSQGLILPPRASVAMQAAAGQAANTLAAVDRSIAADNQTFKDHKRLSSEQQQRIASIFGVEISALNGASAATAGVAPKVLESLQFDFTNGFWTVGDSDRGPV